MEKWFLLFFGVPSILLAIWQILDLTVVASLSAALCVIAFIVTVFVVSPIIDIEGEEKKAKRGV
jgi:hypothetical protein